MQIRAFITGASRGIGRAIALELAKVSTNNVFYLTYNNLKNIDKILELEKEIHELGNWTYHVKMDVSDRAEVASAVNYLFHNSPIFTDKLNVLINNAGILRDRTLKNMSNEEWDECIGVNLTGIFNVTKRLLPYMDKGGSIINITSTVALTGNFGQTNYSAAKAGVIGFTKSLAKELGRDEIRVNAIAVGLCDTDILKPVPKEALDRFIQKLPLKRMATPEEVAKLVRYMAIENKYSTGAIFDFTGGMI
jgi:NAD(P)-dependent dehydrogenase (short-subunit alcohol dehydrogenase family)